MEVDLPLPDPPAHLLCPISHSLMEDPVVCETGCVYDRSSLQAWFATGQLRCPVTNRPLSNSGTFPHLALRTEVLEWLASNGAAGRADELRTAHRASGAAAPTALLGGSLVLRSVRGVVPAQLFISNMSPRPVLRAWINYVGGAVQYGATLPQHVTLQPTYQSHPWVLLDAETSEVLHTHVAAAGAQVLRIEGGGADGAPRRVQVFGYGEALSSNEAAAAQRCLMRGAARANRTPGRGDDAPLPEGGGDGGSPRERGRRSPRGGGSDSDDGEGGGRGLGGRSGSWRLLQSLASQFTSWQQR